MRKKEKIIYKSNDLIESSYCLTVTQQRLVYLFMLQLEIVILENNLNIKEVEDRIKRSNFELLTVNVKDYKKEFNIRSNNVYAEMAKIATELYEEELKYIKPNGTVGRKRWIITCEYNDDNKSIDLQFHPDVIRDLLVLKSEYTKMVFDDFANKIKGKYSFRIYELCKQYSLLGKREFDVDDLRFKLNLKETEYKAIRDFKRVLTSSVNEINKNTDIELSIENGTKDSKGKITSLIFYIKAKSKQMDLLTDGEHNILNTQERTIMGILSDTLNREVTIAESRRISNIALKAIDSIEELRIKGIGIIDYIKEKDRFCREYIYHNKKSVNYMSLLSKALESNWNNSYVSADTIKIDDLNIDTVVNNNHPEQYNYKNKQFNNFKARDYDYDSLEKKLLGWDEE